jgi:3-methylcrotonyl-CoA carboxylase alpha subunit
MFDKVMIANRGEIACRIARSCRRLGVRTVAVHSDVDRHARHVAACDEAVALPGDRAADTYLAMDALLAAAAATGAQAIHPGYGFLAQNAEFARRCASAGIALIGPRADSHERMGSKDAAKRLMQDAGVPVVPGYLGEDQSDGGLQAAAERVGYPLMIKAVAGGGGRGMRRVDTAAAFAEALAAARREAQAAFGDSRVILERFVQGPRHVEVQVFGDAHGNCIHMFERECSIQRRFQKVIEESPSALLDDGLRAAMGAAAVRAARAVDYVNAGTVEFIVGSDRQFYFMEMNTRLQVEHPVTEMLTGLDLVEWQLRIAAGEALPLDQEQLQRHGHAIEVRICAEDANRGFLPVAGRIDQLVLPEPSARLRVDAGFASGDPVPSTYDSLLAKLIVHGTDRADAFARLRAALAETAVFGLTTNLPLLRALAADGAVVAGNYDTNTLDQRLPELLSQGSTPTPRALAAALGRVRRDLFAPPGQGPWIPDGFRADGRRELSIELADAAGRRQRFVLRGHDGSVRAAPAAGGEEFALGDPGAVLRHGAHLLARGGGGSFELTVVDPAVGRGGASAETHPGSPMPGRVVALMVSVGTEVDAGAALLVVEGMKMEFTLRAPVAGKVAALHAAVGDLIEAEAPLVDIEPATAKDAP